MMDDIGEVSDVDVAGVVAGEGLTTRGMVTVSGEGCVGSEVAFCH